MAVFVLDHHKKPLMPCSEKRARLLLERGRARVHRRVPFVIRLVDRKQPDCALQPLRLKIDAGSKVTGMALVQDKENSTVSAINLFELAHRGHAIRDALTARRAMRRRRRGNLRYRSPRFLNRKKDNGWLAPSLRHRIDTTMSWVNRFRRWTPLAAISSELVRFDMQSMTDSDIQGAEYQQGTLFGYEVREYLLEKWQRKCAYCDAVNTPLNIDHMEPRSRGGSNRVSNLVLSCIPCNQNKGVQSVTEFVKDKARLTRILAQIKRPLQDAAAVNATRWALANALKATGLPVELASGAKTKYNRTRLGLPKTHALDASCVGQVGYITRWERPVLRIKCTGRGSYQRTRLDKFGFPRGYLLRQKQVNGFQTGDMVRATVPESSKKAGCYTRRVAVRASGSFNIQTGDSVIQGISHKYCQLLQRADGFGYQLTKIAIN
nr:RNA-guided endonuclease IscB [Escherichia coli]